MNSRRLIRSLVGTRKQRRRHFEAERALAVLRLITSAYLVAIFGEKREREHLAQVDQLCSSHRTP